MMSSEVKSKLTFDTFYSVNVIVDKKIEPSIKKYDEDKQIYFQKAMKLTE